MPICLLQILADLIVLFSSLDNTHVQVSNDEALLSPHLRNRSANGNRNL